MKSLALLLNGKWTVRQRVHCGSRGATGDAPDDITAPKSMVSTSMAAYRLWRSLAIDGSIRQVPLSPEEGQAQSLAARSNIGEVPIWHNWHIDVLYTE